VLALRQFGKQRQEKAKRTLLIPLVAAMYAIDRLIGATGWAAVEELVLVPLLFVAVIWLLALWIQELRERRQSAAKSMAES
jgi:hypothetical protein